MTPGPPRPRTRPGRGRIWRSPSAREPRISDRKPLAGRFRVERLSDGKFAATGPVYAGNHMNFGPMALLKINGLRIVVSSRKQQAADQAIFRHLGVEPAAQKILALEKLRSLPGRFSTDC